MVELVDNVIMIVIVQEEKYVKNLNVSLKKDTMNLVKEVPNVQEIMNVEVIYVDVLMNLLVQIKYVVMIQSANILVLNVILKMVVIGDVVVNKIMNVLDQKFA